MLQEQNKLNFLQRINAAYRFVAGINPSLGVNVPDKEGQLGFRRISAASDKELTIADFQKQIAIVHFLWQTNPLAARILELQTDFIVGDGFTFSAEDPTVEEVLEAHWTDPDNAWDMKQFERCQERDLFGVQLYMPFVNEFNGHVKLATLDPAWITKVITDPKNSSQVEYLILAKGMGDKEKLKVIRLDTDPESQTQGLLMGDIFYFAVEKLSFTAKGQSVLFRLADWLDAYDQFLFHTLERIVFLNSHLYDIEIQNAGPAEINAKVAELEHNPPKAGGFRVHNEKEKWTAVAPKINTAEVDEMARIVKMLILGSAGIPEHWFGDGGNTNVATAKEMAAPILRKFKRKQASWGHQLSFILRFQIDQAIRAKRIKPGTNTNFKVTPPELSVTDAAIFAETLSKLVSALSDSVAANFLTKERASEIFAMKASESGVEVEPANKEEQDQAERDAIAKAKTDAEALEATPYKTTESKPVAKAKRLRESFAALRRKSKNRTRGYERPYHTNKAPVGKKATDENGAQAVRSTDKPVNS